SLPRKISATVGCENLTRGSVRCGPSVGDCVERCRTTHVNRAVHIDKAVLADGDTGCHGLRRTVWLRPEPKSARHIVRPRRAVHKADDLRRASEIAAVVTQPLQTAKNTGCANG